MSVEGTSVETTAHQTAGQPPFPDMVSIPPATYRMGSDHHYAHDERLAFLSKSGVHTGTVLIGQACLALADTDGARMECAAAAEAFRSLGATTDLARVDSTAASRALETSDCLTAREVEVLRLVARGKTNRTIAQELDISEKTVARHIANIFTKLDLSTRAAATAYTFTHRLVE